MSVPAGFPPPSVPEGASAAGATSPTHRTEVLDPLVAAAAADPGARTEVVARPGGADHGSAASLGAELDPPRSTDAAPSPTPAPLLTRRQAAEAGLYAGAGLVALAIVGAVARGWSGWDDTMRAAIIGLAAVSLVAAGLFLRLPWTRRADDERRRAVSVMLTGGAVLALVASGVALGVRQGVPGAPAGAHAVVGAVVMIGVCVAARSPVSEMGLLGALAWAAWLLVPPGPGTWGALVGLGILWAVAGWRWARGRRTAVVAGAALALVASVGLAQGAWAWPVRGVLAALLAAGLVMFLRGAVNAWLALGAGSATALAAAVAGARLGPALALMVGGLATMVVSGIALRASRRSA